VRAVALRESRAVIDRLEPADSGKLFNFEGTNPG